jgi:hypothetical protein
MKNFLPESDNKNTEELLRETKQFFDKDSRLLLLGGKSKSKMTKHET